MIPLLLIIISLSAACVAAADSKNPASEGFINTNSSSNDSAITFVAENKITSAPVDLTAGSGYYSSHPFAIGSGIGSQTELSNADSATSMSHEVGFARDISGKREYTAASRSMQSEFENLNFATTQMQIDETVTSGKVQIGVLSGSDGYAWKNPAIEIEEEYIGTYHISERFAINNSHSIKMALDSWLSYSSESYSVHPSKPVSISADDVFNCLRVGPVN